MHILLSLVFLCWQPLLEVQFHKDEGTDGEPVKDPKLLLHINDFNFRFTFTSKFSEHFCLMFALLISLGLSFQECCSIDFHLTLWLIGKQNTPIDFLLFKRRKNRSRANVHEIIPKKGRIIWDKNIKLFTKEFYELPNIYIFLAGGKGENDKAETEQMSMNLELK